MGSTGPVRDAALGFRSHSGWATLAAVAGPLDDPALVVRRRIELCDSRTPRQPFHAAEGRPLREAGALIRRCTEKARELATQAVAGAVLELRHGGARVVSCGLLAAAGRPLPELAAILASHALVHAAEGELFRDALRHAGRERRLAVVEVREREAFDRAAEVLDRPAAELARRLTEWGRSVGPPWRQDEKLAALAAWVALAGAGNHNV